MKGVSVLVTVFLFVAAVELANLLKRAGVSPVDKEATAETLTTENASSNSLLRLARYERFHSTSQYTE